MEYNIREVYRGTSIAIALSISAVLMSIAVLVRYCPVTKVDFDYMGIIVGILSSLVTVLIGWQIFNIIKIDKLLSEVKDSSEEMEITKHNLLKEIHRHKVETTMCHIAHFAQDIHPSKPDSKNVRLAYLLAVDAIHSMLISENFSALQECLIVLCVCLKYADVLNSWDNIFDNGTNERCNAIYHSILPQIGLLTPKKIETIHMIHSCRALKRFDIYLEDIIKKDV